MNKETDYKNNNRLQITLTANAGVILQTQDTCVLIDAIHNGKTEEFSSVSDEELLETVELLKERHPDMVLVTHRHPDHCTERLMKRFSSIWPGTVFLYPEDFPGNRIHSRLKDIMLTSLALPHDGTGFEDVVQRGYCLTLDGFTILHIGDGALSAQEEILKLVRDIKIDVAIMNFPWITLSAGRRFLEETLKPAHLIVVHLPFEGEDHAGFRKAAFKAASDVRIPDVRVMAEPMQTELIP